MMTFLLLLQAAAHPDIQIGARLSAERVTIEQKGVASLEVASSPEGSNRVVVEAPRADGKRILRNVQVSVDAEARIADPDSGTLETGTVSPR